MKIDIKPILNLRKDGATSTLLIIKDLTILLDCGINENLDISQYIQNKDFLKNVDLILISHPGFEYAGGLPFISSMMNPEVMIFATIPVSRIAISSVIDLVLNRMTTSENQFLNIKNFQKKCFEIYEKILEVKFLEKKNLKLKNESILIVSNNVGHSLGSCAWRIEIDIINIIYMISYNNRSENHLDGLIIDDIKQRKIDLLITNSNNAMRKISLDNSLLEDKIKDSIEKIITGGGIIIISCFSTEQILEIIILLEKISKDNESLKNIPIEFYHTYKNYLKIAKSQIEFMKGELSEQLSMGNNPFDPQSLKFEYNCNFSSHDFDEIPNHSKIIICNYLLAVYGPLQNLLNKICTNEKNHLILVGDVPKCFTDFSKLKNNNLDRIDFNNSDQYITQEFKEFESESIEKIDELQVETFSDTASTRAQSLIANDNIQIQGGKVTSEVLFTFNDFPRFFCDETKAQMSDYGQIIENEELKNWDDNETIIRKDFLSNTFDVPTLEDVQQKYANYIDFAKMKSNRLKKINIAFKLNIKKIDSSNLSDGVSMGNIIYLLNPRNTFIINGDENENRYFLDILNEKKMNNVIPSFNYQLFTFLLDNKTIDFDIIEQSNPYIPSKVNCVANFKINKAGESIKSLIFKSDHLTNDGLESNKLSFFGETSLLMLYNYFIENNIQCVFNPHFLSFFDKKIIIKYENHKISIEAVYCKEYKEIRRLTYNYFHNYK